MFNICHVVFNIIILFTFAAFYQVYILRIRPFANLVPIQLRLASPTGNEYTFCAFISGGRKEPGAKVTLVARTKQV